MALRERVLSNPVREDILEIIERAPASRSVIVELTGASYAVVAYHARVLCRAGAIFRVEADETDLEDPLYELCQ